MDFLNLLVRISTSASYYYLYNGHADVTALLNATTGVIDGTYYYDAFGNILSQTGTADNSIRYSGYQYDPETGLYYLNARMYDPAIARFLQEDTYRGDPNDPLSLNLYAYCANNPLIYSDPTGHRPMTLYTDSGSNSNHKDVGEISFNLPGNLRFQEQEEIDKAFRPGTQEYIRQEMDLFDKGQINAIVDNLKAFTPYNNVESLIFSVNKVVGIVSTYNGNDYLDRIKEFTNKDFTKNLKKKTLENGKEWIYENLEDPDAETIGYNATTVALIIFEGYCLGSMMKNANAAKATQNLDDIRDYETKIEDAVQALQKDEALRTALEGGADFYVAPNGKALPEQYKDWLGTNMRESLINSVDDPTLKKAIGEVYRPGSIVGDGGTADIIRFEQETGILLTQLSHP